MKAQLELMKKYSVSLAKGNKKKDDQSLSKSAVLESSAEDYESSSFSQTITASLDPSSVLSSKGRKG